MNPLVLIFHSSIQDLKDRRDRSDEVQVAVSGEANPGEYGHEMGASGYGTHITVVHELRSLAQVLYAYLSWKSDREVLNRKEATVHPGMRRTLDRRGFSCTWSCQRGLKGARGGSSTNRFRSARAKES